jgi:alkyldihydroxyacetonephosphate synthase
MAASGPPVEWGVPTSELRAAFPGPGATVGEAVVERLRATGAGISSAPDDIAGASRDWWPLGLRWALHGRAPALPSLIVRPSSTEEVAAVLAIANEHRIPVTAAGGRSGVGGGAVPVHGGIALDCCGLSGIREVDEQSMLVTVGAGTFGPEFEAELQGRHGLTVGHRPQSFDLATVGGWIASRGAGQYSTRYGKIEDIVAGLEVVTANGTVMRTGAAQGSGPRSATGPDLTQLFVGSEGTLAVITSAVLRAHPVPSCDARAAWTFERFADGLEALRLTMRAGATPAVLRLYDERESLRSFEVPERAVLIALDEGDRRLVEATLAVTSEAAKACGGEHHDGGLVERWLERRNDVSSLAPALQSGIVVDTIEIAACWSELPGLHEDAIAALAEVTGCLAASAHVSHLYLNGACVYLTFAGLGPDPEDDAWASSYYRASWKAAMDVTLAHRGSISHHHGIGIARGGYLRDALGAGYEVLEAMKRSLDPNGILNPGKLGLASPFGPAATVPLA